MEWRAQSLYIDLYQFLFEHLFFRFTWLRLDIDSPSLHSGIITTNFYKTFSLQNFLKKFWIKVVTLAVYSFFVSSLMGRQFLDPTRKLVGHEVITLNFYIGEKTSRTWGSYSNFYIEEKTSRIWGSYSNFYIGEKTSRTSSSYSKLLYRGEN